MPDLSAPTPAVFWISVVLVILALLGHFFVIPFLTEYKFWIAIVGYVVLFLGNVVRGM
jgi:hypothetical protein